MLSLSFSKLRSACTPTEPNTETLPAHAIAPFCSEAQLC